MKRILQAAAATVVALALAITPSFAEGAGSQYPALDAAKAACDIGERIDGYLGETPGGHASAEAVAEMNEVNIRRRAVYAERARANDQPLNVFARLTGERQVVKAADAGECYMDDGGWKTRGDADS